MKRFIYFLMALLGFGATACDDLNLDNLNPEWEDQVAEYGCPYVNFSLKARVADEQGKAIADIEVSTMQGTIVGYSDEQGYVDGTVGMFPGEYNVLRFEDVDGELNGGEFEPLVLNIEEYVEQEEAGSDSWYGGGFRADLKDVTMKLKQE